MTSETWIPVLLVFSATAFGVLALILMWELFRDLLRQRTLRKRVTEVMGDHSSSAPKKKKEGRLMRTGGDAEPGDLRTAIPTDLPLLRGLPVLLERSDVGWDGATFLTITVGCGFGVAALVFLISGSLLLAAFALSMGLLLPYVYLRLRIRRSRREFEEQLPESLDLLTRAIRAGHPLTAGMRMVAEEGPSRVASEFRKTFEEHRFGLPFEDALLGMVDRVDLVDVRIFATAILIQRQSGGNLAEILDKLGQTIRDRFSIRRQLRVYTAQGRLSGYVLGALPIVVGSLIYVIEPEYVSLLFQETLGRLLLVAAVILQIFGFLWIRKIVNIEI